MELQCYEKTSFLKANDDDDEYLKNLLYSKKKNEMKLNKIKNMGGT